ncbi:hypothetical protein B0H17DRAFT_1196647 [Mycena rosella]|uniref:Uncharacterized protein n=1 Tax=Mycena rosella TaxID=1033263 RepID=A0AAD7DU10_MYCRO|nr:hypothetical protein B0H17DRAFT_1196647 [Mycena rosella]
MPAKAWTNAAQHAYLELQLPDFIRRQAQKKLHLFWGPMHEGWFARFPEQAELGLPLPSDATAPPLTDPQMAVLGAAIEKRKKQLNSWIRRERLKIRGGNAGKKNKKSPLAQFLAKKMRPVGRRVHHPVEIFQMRNKGRIRAKLTERGHDSLNEAARRAAKEGSNDSDDEEETLEEQEAHAKASRSERMRMRTSVVAELWRDASEEERQAVSREIAREKAELDRQRRKEEEESGERSAPTPTEYQGGVDALDELFESVHALSLETSGWVGLSILGGPTPREGGATTVKVICSGETLAGNSFSDACADFEQEIVGRFKVFLDRVFPVSDCLKRAIEQDPVPETQPVELSVDVTVPPPPPLPPKPKRVRKPKKTGPTATPTTTTAETPASSQATPPPPVSSLSAPPSSFSASAFATSAANLGAASWSILPDASTQDRSQGGIPGSLDSFSASLDAEFGPAFVADLNAGVFDPASMFEEEDPFSVGRDEDTLANRTDTSPPPDQPSYFNSRASSFLGEDGFANPTDVSPPPPRPSYYNSQSSLLLGEDPFLDPATASRPPPRPSYKGAPFYKAQPSSRGSRYTPSALFSTFSTPKRHVTAPLIPAASPASMRRKVTGWNSPAQPTGTGTNISTRAAQALAAIVGVTLPTASPMHTGSFAFSSSPPTTLLPSTAAAATNAATNVTIATTIPPSSLPSSSPVATATQNVHVPICRPAAKPLEPPKKARAPGQKRAGAAKGTEPDAQSPATESALAAAGTHAPASTAAVPLRPAIASLDREALDEMTNMELGTINQVVPGMGTSRFNQLADARKKKRLEDAAAAEKAEEHASAEARGYFELPNPNGPTPTVVLTGRRREPRVMFDGTVAAVQKKGVRAKKPKTAVAKAGSKRKATPGTGPAKPRKKARK